jgi:hypothetical protein
VAVPIPAPAPPPLPVAAPAPAVAPAPVAAPTPAPAPVAKPAPIVAPVPAPQKREVAAAAPSAAAIAAPKLDAKTVEQIFSCLAPGLPAEWKRTWVVVSGAASTPSKFYYSNTLRDEDGEEFTPCNAQEITRRIVGLNAALPQDRLGWRSARLVIDNEGAYELKYDYGK